MPDAVRHAFDRWRAFALIGLVIALQASLLVGAAEARRPQMSDVVYPHGFAVDSVTGKIWITSAATDDCRVFALGRAGIGRHVAGNGSCTPSGDGGHARAAGLEPPSKIAVSETHVYVASSTSVRRIERAHGGIGTFVGDPRYHCHLTGYVGPFAEVGRMADEVGIDIGGMALNPVSGNLFVVDVCQYKIFEIDISTGRFITEWFGGGTAFLALGEIAINATGEIYFTSEPYHRTIYKVTGPRTATRVAGTGSGGFSGNNGPATRATFDPVTALTFDDAGNLYLAAGSVYARVMRVDTSGTLTTAIGIGGRGNWGGTPTGRAGDMALRTVTALATDADDNLYIGGVGDTLVAMMEAPFSSNSRWSWLMKDYLGVMEIERNGGKNPAVNNCDQACHGDPVNTATGEYWEEASDLSIPGRGPAINFTRNYGSSNSGVDGPLGYGWTDPYAMALSVDADGYVTVRQENGSPIWFTPDGSGGFDAGAGQFATLEENGDGSYTLVRRQRETFHFAADGRLTGIEDLNGYVTTLGYDGSGRLETITDEAGRTVSLSYDGADRIVGVEDPASRTVEYAYDANGDLVEVIDVRGERWAYTYDSAHRLLTRSDPNGHLEVRNVYSADGEVLSQEDGEGGVTRFEYLPGLTRTTSPEGRVTEYFYAGGQLVQKVEAAGTRQAARWSYEYDLVTRGVTQTVDPRGSRWLATYDAMGLQTSTQTPLGASTQTTYDSYGSPLTQTDLMGVTTTMTYDSGGNLLTKSTPVDAGTVDWSYDYDDAQHPGDVTEVTDPLGKATELAYDRYGNQTSVTDPTGAESTSTYDVLGRVQTTVSPRGNESGSDPADYTTSFAYDAAGDLLSQRDPDGNEQRSTFDRAGNQATSTDAAGKQTRFAYDDADRLVETVRPDATMLLQSYDADGLVTSTTDGAGKRTSYTYDAAGRLATATDPNRRTTTYGYDLAGNRTTALDPAGRTTTSTYDTSNRLTRVAYSDGSPSETFRYDNAGRRTSMTDTTGTSSFTYDALGRLTSHTDGARRAVAYAYDAASRLTTLTYANARAVTRGYDDAGRLTSVTDWLGNATAFDYDRDSHLTRIAFPTGTGMEDLRSYDAAGDLTDVTMKKGATTLASIAYDQDPRGLISQAAQTGLPGTATLDYTYTDLAELASENSDAYRHDGAGNLVTLAGSNPLGYDDAGQLLRGPVPPGSSRTDAEFVYDQRGARTEARPVGGSATTYAYDQAERLKTFTPAGGSPTTYRYDGSGLRVAKTTGTTTKRWTWDRSGALALMLSDAANNYVYGPGGLPIAHITSTGAVRYYHQDALGSTRVLSDARGVTVASFSYTPYGTIAARTGTETTPLGYAGEQTDPESGLQYLRARYYDPATGQFLTRDPLVDQTGQPYAYADGNPTNNTDPTGNIALPSPTQIATRYVGFVDHVTGGATSGVRDSLGLNGGLDKCSLDYQGAGTVGDVTAGALGIAALGYGIATTPYRIKLFEQQARGGRGLFVVRDPRIAGGDRRIFAIDRHPLRPRYENPRTHIDIPQRTVQHWPYQDIGKR